MDVGGGGSGEGGAEAEFPVVGGVEAEEVGHGGGLAGGGGDGEAAGEADVLFELGDAAPIEGVVAGVVGAGGDFVDGDVSGLVEEEFDAEESEAVEGFDGADGDGGGIVGAGGDEVADVVALDGGHGGEGSGLFGGAVDHDGEFGLEGDELFGHPGAGLPERAVGFEFFGGAGVAGAFAIVAAEAGFEDHGEAEVGDDLGGGFGGEGEGAGAGDTVAEVGLTLEEFVLDGGEGVDAGEEGGFVFAGEG